jgi:hypothetical protein
LFCPGATSLHAVQRQVALLFSYKPSPFPKHTLVYPRNMKLCIYNLTDTQVEVSTRGLPDVGSAVEEGNVNSTVHVLQPRRSTPIPRLRGNHVYLHAPLSKQEMETEGKVAVFPVPLPGFWAKRGASWKEISVVNSGACPWRVYWFWVRTLRG